jgi:hexosaminidase
VNIFQPFRPLGDERKYGFLIPFPQKIKFGKQKFSVLKDSIYIYAKKAYIYIAKQLAEDINYSCNVGISNTKQKTDYQIKVSVADQNLPKEAYTISIKKSGIEIIGQDEVGTFYAAQTLSQIFAFTHGELEEVEIKDWPTYEYRSVMIDMGRGVYTMLLLKRVIRIMARLKLNMLHMHLKAKSL